MTSANDFMKVFGGVEVTKHPSVSLDNCGFRLQDIEPYREWIPTGETKPDGSLRYARSEELIFDDTQEKVRCEVSLVIIDKKNNLATSTSAPFVDRNCYLSLDELKKVVNCVGSEVKLKAPRIEFREVSGESKSGYKRIETRMCFVFDGFEL